MKLKEIIFGIKNSRKTTQHTNSRHGSKLKNFKTTYSRKFNNKCMVQELERPPLPLDELTKSWRRMRNIQFFQSFPSSVNKMMVSKKLEQENEEESILGWRMKLIYPSLMTQRLKKTRNKLAIRRSTAELHSLMFEFVQNEGMKAPKDFFSHKDQ